MLYQIDYMKLAINEAIKARKKQEVPVGAIIVDKNGNVIAVNTAGFISLYLGIPYVLTIS